jgi:hypothetical protein
MIYLEHTPIAVSKDSIFLVVRNITDFIGLQARKGIILLTAIIISHLRRSLLRGEFCLFCYNNVSPSGFNSRSP